MNAQSKIESATIHSAMAAAFAEIETAIKTNTGQVGQQKYKYADIASVIDAIKPALVNHGLFFIQKPEPSERGVTIETVIGHSGGETMSLGTLFVPANKSDAQGYGSALTYARRYALVTAFGVPVEDDDGNAAVKSTKADQDRTRNAPKITGDQVDYLFQLMGASKISTAVFCQTLAIKDIPDLPAERFDEAEQRLQARLAKMAKDATNAKAKDMADV